MPHIGGSLLLFHYFCIKMKAEASLYTNIQNLWHIIS